MHDEAQSYYTHQTLSCKDHSEDHLKSIMVNILGSLKENEVVGFTVTFLLFLATTGGYNLAGQSLTFT